MKVGLIRCVQTEDMCPGTGCFSTFKNKNSSLEEIDEDIELVAWNTCGGCPGKKASSRAERMVKRGAEAIILASCISKGTPIGFPCPHYESLKAGIRRAIGDEIPIIEYTHI